MAATKYPVLDYVILVDEHNKEIGTAEKLSAHVQNLLHRAFSIFVFRREPRFELLLQQRAFEKYHSEGLWTNTCCSHPRYGEHVIDAGKRRLQEELGITTALRDLGWFRYNVHFANGLFENEIDHVLVGFVPKEIKIVPNKNEIYAYRWITLPELHQEIISCPENFTPWFQAALKIAQSFVMAN